MAEDRAGSAADRKLSTTGMTATGAAAGLTIGLADWAFLQCMAGGSWHVVAPSQNLIEVGAPIILLPVALWLGRVAGLIGDIIIKRLERNDQ